MYPLSSCLICFLIYFEHLMIHIYVNFEIEFDLHKLSFLKSKLYEIIPCRAIFSRYFLTMLRRHSGHALVKSLNDT